MNKEDVVYIWSGVLLSHKKQMLPFVTTWMDLKGIMLSEISPRKTNTALSHLYVESKKQSNHTNKTK